ERYPDDKDVMELKEAHTFRVCDEITGISDDLGLTEPQRNLAEMAALFHDLGRFEQYARYRTFSDHRTENHALLSAKILKNLEILVDYDDAIQELLDKVISWHNLPRLPEGVDEHTLFFARLLRDADKLDILRLMINAFQEKKYGGGSEIAFGLPDTPDISDAVVESLLKSQFVDMPSMKTLSDYKLLLLGLTFDVNFAPSFKRIRERRYMEQIRKELPDSEKVDQVFKAVESHIDRNLRNL
ncbi:HD domain-containing protein, partial [Candidatus Sumerlaeota bacterium]|nr:HD domain-containing protein [Candidatus Sumerlaeota bacterium]